MTTSEEATPPATETFKLPSKLDEVTPEVLDLVLSAKYPGVSVEAAEFSLASQGSTSRARVALTYRPSDAAASMPSTMWLKSSFSDFTEMLAGWQLLEMEARFYQMADSIEVRAPKAFGALFDSDGQSLLLLEDLTLTGTTFNDALTPLSFEAARSVVDELARFHASLWGSPRFAGDLAWLHSTVEGALAEFNRNFLVDLLPELVEGPRRELLSGPLLDLEAMATAWVNLQEVTAESPQTLLHYDAHVGNTFFDSQGRGGLLDWQCLRRGHWSADVNYFITSALTVEDRRSWEEDLLRRYLEQLAAHGIDAPGFDEAWTQYRRQPLYGLVIWMLSPPEQQPEDICRACSSRFAAAVLDHQTLELLGAH
jgi:aminoglycoside phosphotransferase (APT) family kinase protein